MRSFFTAAGSVMVAITRILDAHFEHRNASTPYVRRSSGDFISFSGTVGGKAPSNVEKTDAKWDAHFIWSVVRNKKPVYELSRIEPCR